MIVIGGTVGACRPEMEASNQILYYATKRTETPTDVLLCYTEKGALLKWVDNHLEVKNKYVVEYRYTGNTDWEQGVITDVKQVSIGKSGCDVEANIDRNLEIKLNSFPYFYSNPATVDSTDLVLKIMEKSKVYATQCTLKVEADDCKLVVSWLGSPRCRNNLFFRVNSAGTPSDWFRISTSSSTVEFNKKMLGRYRVRFDSDDLVQFKLINTIDKLYVTEQLSEIFKLNVLNPQDTSETVVEEDIAQGVARPITPLEEVLETGVSPIKKTDVQSKLGRKNAEIDALEEIQTELNAVPTNVTKNSSVESKDKSIIDSTAVDKTTDPLVMHPKARLKRMRKSQETPDDEKTDAGSANAEPDDHDPLTSKRSKHAGNESETSQVLVSAQSSMESGQISSSASVQESTLFVHDQQAIGNPKNPFYMSLKFGDNLSVLYEGDTYLAYICFYEYVGKHWTMYITYHGFPISDNETLNLGDPKDLDRIKKPTKRELNTKLYNISELKRRARLTSDEITNIKDTNGEIYLMRVNDCPFRI